MPSASTGHLKVAIPGGSTFRIKVDPADGGRLSTRTVQRLTPVARQDADISYSSYDSRGGIVWDVLARAYLGCGKALADDGGYAIADRVDLRWGQAIPGPRVETEYPGIPGLYKVLGHVQWGTTDFVWTDQTASGQQVFRKASGEVAWHNGTSGAVWTGLPAVAATCMVAMGDFVAVGFGSGTVFSFLTTPNTGTGWSDSTKAANAKYMQVAAIIANDDGAVGTRAVYGVQTTTAGETFFVTSLANTGTDTTGSLVGESAPASGTTQDGFTSVAVAPDGNILWGKKRKLYNYDVAGVVTPALGVDFEVKTASDDGVSGSTAPNFRDPVTLPNGYMYWIVGDYDILEREPVNGTFNYKSLRLFGPDVPVMQLPVLAIANIGNELYVAVGTTSTSVFNVASFPAGATLAANTIGDGTSYLFAGAYRELPDGSTAWVYHGYLAKLPSALLGFMWYSAEAKRLFMASAETNAYTMYGLRTQDNLATATNYTGTSLNSVILNDQDTAANGDYLYVGMEVPFSGLYATIGAANANASVMTVRYWNGASWASISANDKTTGGVGISLSAAGAIWWAQPTNWVKDDLVAINSPAPGGGVSYRTTDLFWVRIEFSVALDNGVTVTIYPSGLQQQAARIGEGHPLALKLDGTNVLLNNESGKMVETGKFIDRRPNIPKLARRIEGQIDGVSSSNDRLVRVYYRVVADDDKSTAFTEMATVSGIYSAGFNDPADARTGVEFPDNVTFRNIRFQFELDGDGTPTVYTYPVLYGMQLTWLDYTPRQQQLECAFRASNNTVTPEGVASGKSKKGWYDLITEWQDAVTPATVTIVETGEAWDMDLVDGAPIIDRVTGMVQIVAREVA